MQRWFGAGDAYLGLALLPWRTEAILPAGMPPVLTAGSSSRTAWWVSTAGHTVAPPMLLGETDWFLTKGTSPKRGLVDIGSVGFSMFDTEIPSLFLMIPLFLHCTHYSPCQAGAYFADTIVRAGGLDTWLIHVLFLLTTEIPRPYYTWMLWRTNSNDYFSLLSHASTEYYYAKRYTLTLFRHSFSFSFSF